MAARIEDYALIGDCETAALVDKNGSIDWLCWPDFSSDACFASLLGREENGYWKIVPAEGKWKTTRRYRPHTLILETTFESAAGSFRLIDFMPVRQRSSHIVRIVEGIRGKVDVGMELSLRFDYGRTVPWVTHVKDGVRAVAGPNLAVLRASVAVRGEDMKTVADFTVSRGRRVSFSLAYGASHKPNPRKIEVAQALKDCELRWHRWSQRLKYKGKYRDAVERSLMTLRALIYRPTGGVVAAVTTSLPESIGGVRNWDYRLCWLRDTTFTLLALANGGYFNEAAAWQNWLLRALAGSPEQVQIMYGLKGERQLLEWEVGWLSGYENSRPVRIGNAAAAQVQLDIYGEVLDCFFHAQHCIGRHTEDDFRALVLLMEHLETIWQEPDEGIWETRGGPQQFTYSKMMAWVAFDRAVLLAEQMHCEAPVEKWKSIRDTIHSEVCARAFSAKKNSFVRAYGSEQLDASLLLMPVVGFLPGSDPRVKATVEAIERELMPGGLVMRYDTAKADDGLPPGEGVFLACSFWMVSALKSIGRIKDARVLFERLLRLRNDLGLLSEEYDVQHKRLVGNFPQAFSHIALVNAAFDLAAGPHMRSRAHRNAHPKRPTARKTATRSLPFS
ncbi:MAG TPA: glycoside hydrolase family 15 protein [Terracidiphilus sp.]|jgi:GH15 family glucan-1,4-alpha-glucosidase|nr:glycoside hydrolase family 15 protein [Terracidiphilus sp.]